MSDLTQNIETLSAALVEAREESIGRAVNAAQAFVERIRADLAAVEGRIDEIAPRPRGFESRAVYMQAKARRAGIEAICNVTSVYEGSIATVSADKAEAFYRRITLDAVASFEGYVAKLAAKIGRTIASATLTGLLWQGSTLRVTFDDGTVEVWKTRQILNVSSLGTLFNQWPTRKVK